MNEVWVLCFFDDRGEFNGVLGIFTSEEKAKEAQYEYIGDGCFCYDESDQYVIKKVKTNVHDVYMIG